MKPDFHSWAGQVKRLHHALGALAPLAAALGVPPPHGEEWFALLEQKLLPQLDNEPVLVAAVVGGTNIGKSVIFNHLVGDHASGVSPLAAGTRHPVCLAPVELARPDLLETLFAGFELRRWQSADDPLTDCAEHLLFWRSGGTVPPRLLLLDTPDIDSDAVVNWQRADHIRQAADVLVAVLTQQKYNDAAVKQFFRHAAQADKPVVVVFNQCQLDDDREYWPQWLATFSGETGAHPELVYVVPYDRNAAASLRLPFYPVGADGRHPLGEPVSLRDDLAALHFDAVKIRTFKGALARVLSQQAGAGAYLAKLEEASGQFRAAAHALSTAEMLRMSWPALPPGLLVDEIRSWWDTSRSGWSRQVHGFYRQVGNGVMWPLRVAWRAANGPPVNPAESFRERERQAIIEALERLLGELERLAQLGNTILSPRLGRLLSGNSRRQLIDRVTAAHAALAPLDEGYRAFVRDELCRWSRDNPTAVRMLRSLDHAAALARPAITVSLALSGWFLAGDVVGQAATHLAGHTAGTLATEAAIAGGITGGGEAVVAATGEGVKHAAARLFRRLQEGYAEMRAAWLCSWLDNEFLGGLHKELEHGATATATPAFEEVREALERMKDEG